MSTKNTDNLSELRLAARSAAESFYLAGATYYTSLEANTPEQEVRATLEQCLILGEEYKAALYKLLSALESSNVSYEEKADIITEAKDLLEPLEVELSKLSKAMKR